jgi:hypothetical protein
LHDLAECVWDAIENTEMIKAKERNNYQTAWSMQALCEAGLRARLPFFILSA